MLKALATGALVASLAHPTAVQPTASDDPPIAPPSAAVWISVASYSGSGCVPPAEQSPDPRPPVRATVRSDSSGFDITYSNNEARVGLGATPVDFRRNCQVAVAMDPPPGYTYTIASGEYLGQVSLAAGASAGYRAIAYSSGQQTPTSSQHTAVGPAESAVSFSSVADPAAAVWAPCGGVRLYNVSTDIRVSAGTSDVRRTTSTADIGSAGFTVHWKRC